MRCLVLKAGSIRYFNSNGFTKYEVDSLSLPALLQTSTVSSILFEDKKKVDFILSFRNPRLLP
jgi:hypothetical protein